jgi:hypothetical protein
LLSASSIPVEEKTQPKSKKEEKEIDKRDED